MSVSCLCARRLPEERNRKSHGSRMYARPAGRKINKVSLIAFKSNELGNHFWKDAGWCFREDLNYYDFTLNEANITRFNQ